MRGDPPAVREAAAAMFTVHATRKLLERVKAPVEEPVPHPTPTLGNWYATAILWRPQVALFVSDGILLPVLLPLAPARTLLDRFPTHLGQVLEALGVDPGFVATETAAHVAGRYARTASRSRTGTMTEFTALVERRRERLGVDDMLELSTFLAGVPCTPLYGGLKYPDRELAALVASRVGS